MYNNLEIDIYGRPQFQNPIYVRPTKIGSLFYIVEYRDSKISSYILVNVLMAEGEYENPFTNIYYTTSIGLVGGLETSKAILRGGGTSDPAANTILLVTAVSAPIIGPVGGFVYGIGDSSFDLVYDLQESYLMDYEEDLVSLTSLNYDVENRIISLNEYKKNDKKRKVQEFHYKKLNTNPCRIFERLSYEGDIFAESLVEENLLLEEDLCPTSKLKEP